MATCLRIATLTLVALGWIGTTLADTPASIGVQDLLRSSWTVSVDKDPRTRTFRIESVQGRSESGTSVSGRFGWSGEQGSAVTAEVTGNPGTRHIVLTTPSNAKISVAESSGGTFAGTLMVDGGRQRRVTLTRETDTASSESPSAVGRDATAMPAPVMAAVAPSATAPSPGEAPKVMLVWMGGNDCPPCRAWRGVELPKLQATAEFKRIDFEFVTKNIEGTVPPAMFLPDPVKPYKEILDKASHGGRGSPQVAVIVDGVVFDYFHGTRSAEEVEAMLRAIRTGTTYPVRRCAQMASSGYTCETYASR